MLRNLFARRLRPAPLERTAVDVKTVRLSRPKPPRRLARFVLSCAVTYFILEAVRYLDPIDSSSQKDAFQEQLENSRRKGQVITSPIGKDGVNPKAGRLAQQLEKNAYRIIGKNAGESDAQILKLTLPVWIRKGPTRQYDLFDPEFREFAKLQGDEKKMAHLKKLIADSIIRQVTSQRRNSVELRMIRFTGKVAGSLEIVPQPFVPPLYEVPCLYVSSNAVSLGWRLLPADTGPRMERIFRPLVLLDASLAASKSFASTAYGITRAKVNEWMGWGSRTGSRPKALANVQHVVNQQASDVTDEESASSSLTKSKKPNLPFVPQLKNGQAAEKMHQDVVSSLPYSLAITNAAATFNHVRMMRQKTAVATNFRGVCQIRGTMFFYGENGVFKMEIVSHYLPMEDVFLGAIEVKHEYVVQDYHVMMKRMEDWSRKRRQEHQSRMNESSATNEQSQQTERVGRGSDTKDANTGSTLGDDERKEK